MKKLLTLLLVTGLNVIFMTNSWADTLVCSTRLKIEKNTCSDVPPPKDVISAESCRNGKAGSFWILSQSPGGMLYMDDNNLNNLLTRIQEKKQALKCDKTNSAACIFAQDTYDCLKANP